MYIYNVTVNIDESVHKEWLSWIQNPHTRRISYWKFYCRKINTSSGRRRNGWAYLLYPIYSKY